MDAPAIPGDPLAQPTRARLFRILSERRQPVATDELADRLGMHVNGIRMHLETMVSAGLISRSREKLSRGRPRDLWRIAPDARPGGGPPTGYAELSLWLVRTLIASGAEEADLEAVGVKIGREMADSGEGEDVRERMLDILGSLGYRPERTQPADDRVHYCLRNCPYRDAVHERQPLICGLHRGLTQGLVEALAPEVELVSFIAKDPDTAGCEIELRSAGESITL